MKNLNKFMEIAIDEAKSSLREGNHGFGAVIIKNNELLAKAHDLEETDCDSTSHAEINAIKQASKKIGKNLNRCILISTHEPCPMCATAIVWANIEHIAYGYSINESISQGRKRIDLTCDEVFKKAGREIKIEKNILNNQCSVLYNKDVRREIKKLRDISEKKLKQYNRDSGEKRINWFDKNRESFIFINDDYLESAYKLLLKKLNINSFDAPVYKRTKGKIVFHSKNFCPTLEACKILEYDTRYICRSYNEDSTDKLVKQINKDLQFTRNYKKIRPYFEYCEEMITMNSDKNNDT